MSKSIEIFGILLMLGGMILVFYPLSFIEINSSNVSIGIHILNGLLIIFISISLLILFTYGAMEATLPQLLSTSLSIFIMDFIFELKSDSLLFNVIAILVFIITASMFFYIQYSKYKILKLLGMIR